MSVPANYRGGPRRRYNARTGPTTSICVSIGAQFAARSEESSDSCVLPLLPPSLPFTPTDAPHLGVTNNVITSQVASGLIRGLFPFTTNAAALIQSSTFDSLEPTYSCTKAFSLKADYTTGANGQVWRDHLELAKPVYAQLDRISGVEQGDGAGWHASFDQYVFFVLFLCSVEKGIG